MKRYLGLALVALSALGLVGAARAGRSSETAASPRPALAKPAAPAAQLSPSQKAPRERTFPALRPLRIFSKNFAESLIVGLYDEQGQVDEGAARRLDTLLSQGKDGEPVSGVSIDRRTLQLLFRAAYHFKAEEVEIISAYRKPGRRRQGQHAAGRAIDFKLPRVKAAALAAYLRTLPRVGVGVYTHPKTQYVHLDVREQSFHWLDGSPPGRTWRERSLGSKQLAARDATYTRASDWPEGTKPPEAG